MTKKHNTNIILILACLNGLMPFSTDLYLPAFGNIATDLNISFGQVALTMSAFFAGSCVGQLLNGPFLDKFGRKKPILFGLGIFALTSMGCAFSNSLNMLLLLRFVQALGISLCAVGSRAVVRDIFPANEIAYVFSTLALIMGIAPIIAPSVGSLVLGISSWRGIFFLLTGFSIFLMLLVQFKLPESKADTGHYSMHPKTILNNYIEVLKTPNFLPYALITSLASGSLFAWISSSSMIFMKIFGLSAKQFGWVFASTASCLIISNQGNRLLLNNYPSKTIAFNAAKYQFLVSVLMLVVVTYFFNMPTMLGVLFLFMLGLHLITPNAMALSVKNFSQHIGTANAILGSFTMTISALVTSFLGWMYNGTPYPMVFTMMALAILSSIIQYSIIRK